MSATAQLSHLITALGLLLISAHALGRVFRRYRQPQVIGEICGGILLGPTVLGHFLPELHSQLFVDHAQTRAVLDAIYQFGLQLLMFCSGLEMRSQIQQQEKKVTLWVSFLGIAIPFVLALTAFRFFDFSQALGSAGSQAALVLVFAIAISITSIPVISRILMDLGLMQTSLARIILAAAVVEDIVLYVVLSIAIGLAGGEHSQAFGLPVWLGLDPRGASGLAYHMLAPIVFFGITFFGGHRAFDFLRRLTTQSWQLNPLAALLTFMMGMTGIAIALGITPIFGSFLAGIVAAQTTEQGAQRREVIRSFASAFFIPAYFAMVGLRLNLIRDFNLVFFVVFFAFACAAKILGVYCGARLAGEPRLQALNLSVAMNARGGPGIVLASVALGASIISEQFYTSLLMLAILTSLGAGSWLEFALRRGWIHKGSAPARTQLRLVKEPQA